MDSGERISIVLASDNHYAILIAAMIKSIEINHKTEEPIDFYVLDDNISEKNKAKVLASIHSEKISINWVDVHQIIPPTIKIPVDTTPFPLTAYFRLFAPYVVPPELDRILFLDVDTIILTDISRLWHTDIGDYLFGAVQDFQKVVSHGGVPNYKELGMAPDTKYFNTGVLLIKAREWRDADVTNRVFACSYKNIKHIIYADQYGLNVTLANQWFELDPRWNWFSLFETPDDPFLIHFVSTKPIFTSYKYVPRFKTLFYSYLNQTTWKNHQPINGNYNNMRKVYNLVKKVVIRNLNRPN
ncbi:glycosyltransferase family 8 protein [Spirosoma validum]|uniref:Glycosyltransferase family 8 protein n=1 Tax=Spirosoma validum TaxID=2771355 RepID=A0A927AYW1_9BACT|nr:glycosyltransferase family 8 protein [Spirosoma validum]MBD2752295.1 glycosyltransferase family 8 protein [Spirosoma validum]